MGGLGSFLRRLTLNLPQIRRQDRDDTPASVEQENASEEQEDAEPDDKEPQ